MNLRDNSRGQIFSTDFLFAATVFLLILVTVILVSNQFSSQWLLQQQNRQRDEAAKNTSDILLYTQGLPSFWEDVSDLNSVYALGLAKTRNDLSAEKTQRLAQLFSTDYQTVKDFLGANRFELYILVTDLETGAIVAEMGNEPNVEKPSSAVTRIAKYNAETVLVRVVVSEK